MQFYEWEGESIRANPKENCGNEPKSDLGQVWLWKMCIEKYDQNVVSSWILTNEKKD